MHNLVDMNLSENFQNLGDFWHNLVDVFICCFLLFLPQEEDQDDDLPTKFTGLTEVRKKILRKEILFFRIIPTTVSGFFTLIS
jgi:hypothetical protein